VATMTGLVACDGAIVQPWVQIEEALFLLATA
jgi:hypothetical protein